MTLHTSSADGTSIAYERSGTGRALIVVDGALCSRGFGPSAGLSTELRASFEVIRYDRRGRGESGDTAPYSVERELDDLRALVAVAGGRASLLGLSSGGALALHAAAAGLPIEGVIAYEPPYVYEAGPDNSVDHESHLRSLIARGDRGKAVTYFMRDMVGAPWFVPVMMRMFFWMWPKLTAVAHTLPYDAAVMTRFRVPRDRFAGIGIPVRVLNGSRTDVRLKAAARHVTQAVPGAGHAELAGQTHNVNPGVLARSVIEWLSAPTSRR